MVDYMTTPDHPFNSQIIDYDDDVIHTHEFYEIVYILEGSINHVLNGEVRTLRAGDIVYMNLNDVHGYLRESGNTCKHRDIVMRTDFFDSLSAFLGQEFKTAYCSGRLPKIISLPMTQIENYEQRITNTLMTFNIESDYRLASIRALCISLLNNLIEEQIYHNDTYYPMWYRELLGRFHVLDFLRAGLDYILEPFHFNKAYLCRSFRKYTGCTMTEYLNKARLQQAAFQLQYTDKTILAICNDVGFASVSYFNKLFKHAYGVSPRYYRKNLVLSQK